jgi:hypothetical protein
LQNLSAEQTSYFLLLNLDGMDTKRLVEHPEQNL